jgi:peptide/nickel transport system permease protein
MAAFFLALGVLTLRRRIRTASARLLVIVLPAILVAVVWKAIFPDVHDPRPYRRMIAEAAFAESGGRVFRTLIPYGENENIITEAQQPPTWMLSPDEQATGQHWHWLGTDTNGRDVLARMVYGARVSMLVGVLAVSVYTIIGIFIGAIAGFFGGWIDIIVSRLIEIVICFPPLILILAVQAFLAPSIMNIVLALAALWWTAVARLQRAEFLRLVNMDYIQAVRALGGSNPRIIFLHLLPNGFGPILVLVSFGIAGSILIESGLSFLGFGVPQPLASWGDLLNNGRNDIQGLWWLTVFPGIAIFATVTCFNLIGEGVRDALDPMREH